MENETIGNLYTESEDAGNKYRYEQLHQLLTFIESQKNNADIKREQYFKPDFSTVHTYNESIEPYRQEFIGMLGWPLTNYSVNMPVPHVESEFVGKDDLGDIYRLNITALPGLTSYGILFLPKGNGPFPLIISQHGGLGTPELCSGFFGSANYNDMTRRVLRKGFAVFAPQLLLWGEQFGPKFDREHIDMELKQLGGSITALEIFKVMRSLDYLLSRTDIDKNKVGMMGLSYGGFYTLFTAAVDIRIKAALSSCFFNNRYVYDSHDWIWFNSANTFLDAEVCALICPRSLYIEAGKTDDIFDIKYVYKEYRKVELIYLKLGISNNLGYKEFDGGHELDKGEEGIEFLCDRVSHS